MKQVHSVLTALCLLLMAVPVVQASGTVSVTVPSFPVTLNGQAIDYAAEEYPLLFYRDITYLPLTWYGCRLLGLQTSWSWDEGLVIATSQTSAYRATPATSSNAGRLTATIATGKITLNGTVIDNLSQTYPFLLFRDVTYLPMTWHNMVDLLGCAYVFTLGDGLVISPSTWAGRAEEPGLVAAAGPALEPIEAEAVPALEAPEPAPASAVVWEGWSWYLQADAVCRTDGQTTQTLFNLPGNENGGSPVDAALFVQGDSLWLRFYQGGPAMGGERLFRVDSDGSSQEVTDHFASLQMQGDVLVQIGKLTPPYPGNLSVSYDGGATWQALGDPDYCYGAAVQEDDSGTTYVSNNDMTILDGFVYVLGVWDIYHQQSGQPLTAVVCRVDLFSGETTPLTGEATGFSVTGGLLTYTTPDGQTRTLPLGD